MAIRHACLAATTAAALLLGLAPAAQAEIRVSPNFNLASDSSAFRARDQIGLAVNRTNPQHVVAINANYLDLECEASVSKDGGTTWSEAVPLLPPDPVSGAPYSKRCNFHQSVVFGSGENVYAVVTASRPTVSSPDSAVLVYKSADGGTTWQRGVVAMPEGEGSNDPVRVASQGPTYTRPAVAVDPGAGPGGADRVYTISRDFIGAGNRVGGCVPATRFQATTPVSCPNSVQVAVSSNSGQSFGERVQVSPVGLNAQDPPVGVVNDDASLTVVWRQSGTGSPSPTNPSNVGKLQTSRSTTPGVAGSWSPAVDIAGVRNTGGNTHLIPTIWREGVTGTSTTATYPRLATDPTRPGWIYMVYGQTPPGPTEPDGGYQGSDHFIGYDIQVWFQRSKDRGLTWSRPERVSDSAEAPGSLIHQTRQPNIGVSPDGRVNVVWQDRRHWYQSGMPFPGDTAAARAINDASMQRTCTFSHTFCEDIRLGDTYYSTSVNGGDTFSSDIRISDRSHNNDVGYDTRPASGYWSWGPQVVTVGGGRLLIGWMDSREGNWDSDTEDFYLAKLDLDASGPDPQTNIDEPDAIARSVALSKLGYQGGNEGALVGGARDPAYAGLPACTSPISAECAVGGVASRNTSAVVIVNQSDVAGAMAGTVLARANPGPVLLSPSTGLPASVKAEVARIRPARAFVIGDTASLSAQVAIDVAAAAGILPGQVKRLSGATDAATAALIPAEFDYRVQAEKDADVPGFDAAVIANPATPDAAAAVGLAAARRLPILYVNAGSVPAETTAALESLDIKKALVVGGTDDVNSSVIAQLQALPGLTQGAQRLGGADEYETSRAVVGESAARGLPSNVVYVADGANPMDATLLGGVVARATGMLVLARTPLTGSAAGQAADFGLTGIDRFILLGPAPSVAPPPPPPVAPPPPPPPPPPAVVPPPPAAPVAGPVLSKVSLTRRSFRARLGTTIRFTLSKDAKVRIVVARRSVGRIAGRRSCVALTRANRKRRPCVRYVTRGTLTSNRKKGTSRVRFSGRVAGRFLAPGSYRFTLRATDSGGRRSNAVNVTFRVVR